jgi:hypothetical protein
MRVFVTAFFGLVIALLGYHGREWLGGATAAKVSAKRGPKLGRISGFLLVKIVYFVKSLPRPVSY